VAADDPDPPGCGTGRALRRPVSPDRRGAHAAHYSREPDVRGSRCDSYRPAERRCAREATPGPRPPAPVGGLREDAPRVQPGSHSRYRRKGGRQGAPSHRRVRSGAGRSRREADQHEASTHPRARRQRAVPQVAPAGGKPRWRVHGAIGPHVAGLGGGSRPRPVPGPPGRRRDPAKPRAATEATAAVSAPQVGPQTAAGVGHLHSLTSGLLTKRRAEGRGLPERNGDRNQARSDQPRSG
jgi:hypothetical protein